MFYQLCLGSDQSARLCLKATVYDGGRGGRGLCIYAPVQHILLHFIFDCFPGFYLEYLQHSMAPLGLIS